MNSKVDVSSKRDLVSFFKSYNCETVSNCPVTSISISPFTNNILLTTHSSSLIDLDGNEGYCLLWGTMVPEHPYCVLLSPEPVQNALFHPANRDWIIGTLYSGHIAVWDLHAGSAIAFQSNSGEGTHFLPIMGSQLLGSGYE